MQSYTSKAVKCLAVVDVLLWPAPFCVIFRLMESIIKKHAGKKRSPCHLLTQQNCKGEGSGWQWWRALEIGYSARQLRVFSGSALDRIAVILSLIFCVPRKAAIFIHQVCPKKCFSPQWAIEVEFASAFVLKWWWLFDCLVLSLQCLVKSYLPDLQSDDMLITQIKADLNNFMQMCSNLKQIYSHTMCQFKCVSMLTASWYL